MSALNALRAAFPHGGLTRVQTAQLAATPLATTVSVILLGLGFMYLSRGAIEACRVVRVLLLPPQETRSAQSAMSVSLLTRLATQSARGVQWVDSPWLLVTLNVSLAAIPTQSP